ncbi:MAG TPA: FAD-dependent oxidoreductase, partial [Streptosporangiaceae bacterium]|nr:FAD-dependent oxidoreductase [Streptosporangiaceae bacterium]
PHVTVLTDRCAGCQECVVRCPAAALTMDAARWVAVADDALCVGCRQCERTCPFSAVTVEGPVLVAERAVSVAVHPGLLTGDADEVRRGFASAEEALAEANRCLDCPDPTCVRGCPAHNDIPSFVAAIRDGDLARAHDVLRLTSVLPDVCSRVCDQAAQCEGACTWSLAGGTPVAIGRLERYVADRVPVPPPVRPAGEGATLSVAVVGSGPAGIGAAWRLAEAGAAVTVYERDQQPGGLLDWGIPDFTLPEDVSARPWAHLIAAGVDLHCGTEVGPADIGRLLDEHDAVVLAHGAAVGLRLPVPGADLGGVVDATSFLKAGKAALRNGDTAGFRQAFGLPLLRWKGERPVLVLVLGAGNTAMDVARTARRIGLHAVCVDWMDERFALARPDELDEGRDEGVEVRFLRTVTRLDGKDGRVCRATLAKTRQDRPDRRPKVLAADTEHVYADLVVMAMGYRGDPAYAAMLPGTPVARTAAGLPDRQWLASGILANPAPEFARHKSVGMLALGREAGLAAAAWPVQERVWLAGDALVGPSTVVEAMAQGRRAATSILATRPSRGPRREPQRVLVAYESRGGRTARAAHLVADKLRVAGAVVRAVPLGQVRAAELAETDLLVIGTWVEGFVVSGVGPPQATRSWLAGLPRLAGLRTAAFCTFGVSPRGTLKGLSQELESRGAAVLAEAAFGPGDHGMADGTARFAERLIAAAWPSRTSQPA